MRSKLFNNRTLDNENDGADSNSTNSESWEDMMKDKIARNSQDNNPEYLQALAEIAKLCATLLPKSDDAQTARKGGLVSVHGAFRSVGNAERADCRAMVSRAAAADVAHALRHHPAEPLSYLEVPPQIRTCRATATGRPTPANCAHCAVLPALRRPAQFPCSPSAHKRGSTPSAQGANP